MKCLNCNSEIYEERETCSDCGLPLTSIALKKADYPKRTGWITFFSIWAYVGFATDLFLTLAFLYDILTEFFWFAFILFLCSAVTTFFFFWAAHGLWRLKSYGRKILLVFAYFWLILFPIGTIIGILTIRYFKKPTIKALFSEKELQSLSEQQIMEIALMAKKRVSAATVAASVLVSLAIFLGPFLAITIPNFIKANQRAKQKNTMKDITNISLSINDYITDHGRAPDQEGIYDENSEFYKAIYSYLRIFPIRDSWGNHYHVYCGEACNGKYGLFECNVDDFIVVSRGRDGKKESWSFDLEYSSIGFFPTDKMEDFNKDIVMFNNSWIRAPIEFAKKEGQIAAQQMAQLTAEIKELNTKIEELNIILDDLTQIAAKKHEVADITTQIKQLASDSNLTIIEFTPQNEIEHEVYLEYPISMEITGYYHHLGSFFDSLCKFYRLVNVDNISIKSLKGNKLSISCIAKTFIFDDIEERFKKESTETYAITEKFNRLKRQKSLMETEIEAIKKFRTDQLSPAIIMDELSTNMPDKLWLTSVDYHSNKLDIKGKSISNTLIADYISNLDKSPNFRDVNLVEAAQRKIQGKSISEFTIVSGFTCPVYSEEEIKSKEFFYRQTGKRDPYKTFLEKTALPEEPKKAGKEVFSVEKIVLLGIVKQKGEYRAIVSGPDGTQLFVKEGDQLYDGFVLSIDEKRIIFRKELKKPIGDKKFQDIVKNINN